MSSTASRPRAARALIRLETAHELEIIDESVAQNCGRLQGRVEPNARRRAGFGPRAEMLETRALLSQFNLAAVGVVRHSGEGVPAVLLSTQPPSFKVTYRADVPGPAPGSFVVHPTASVALPGGDDLAPAVAADDDTSGTAQINGQVEVQLDQDADDDTSEIAQINGQVRCNSKSLSQKGPVRASGGVSPLSFEGGRPTGQGADAPRSPFQDRL